MTRAPGSFRGRASMLAGASALAGCASLLPTSLSEVTGRWHSFDEAKATIEAIVPDRTTVTDLRAAGIDPYASTNVQLLSYSDVLLRFPLNASFAGDPGLRECLAAGKACIGYSINVRETKKDHVGSFWQDTLGFKRVVETSGWQFNALILLVGDRVVYTIYGGQPNLHEQEITRQPLGPAQNLGDAIPRGR
jgi:hypothetical protein